MVPKEGSEKPKLLNLVNDPQRSEAEYKTSKRLTFATRRSIRKLEIGGNSSSSTTIETTSTIKMKGYHLETPEISFDESVTGKIKFWKDAPHMLLYVDDYTVMEEVTDLTQLRKGDHCIVGLNPVRKLCGCCDALVFRLASWEILRLYHHFIMFDNVISISEDGVPMNSKNEPARICEYSNTPVGAIKLLLQVGWRKFFRNPAPFQQLSLHDYQDGRAAFGIYRVMGDISNAERREIVSEAKSLMTSYKPYDIFFRNCEHAAWGLNPKRRLWISPQVPWFLYNLARFLMNIIGCFFLYQIDLCVRRDRQHDEEIMIEGGLENAVSADNSSIEPQQCHHFTVTIYFLMYHVSSTLSVALQVLVSLVRSAVLLTEQKAKLGELTYFFLLTKEVARAAISGGLAIAIYALLPAMLWNRRFSLYLAMYLVVTAYFACDVLFNVSFVLVTKSMNQLGVGVPVAVFASKRKMEISGKVFGDNEDGTHPLYAVSRFKNSDSNRKNNARGDACARRQRSSSLPLIPSSWLNNVSECSGERNKDAASSSSHHSKELCENKDDKQIQKAQENCKYLEDDEKRNGKVHQQHIGVRRRTRG
mmetsp:Transcript_5288/g.7412  ORF Transcript_5288/g.7412 Transcript_5288/m.7412 type:complete len:589 (-) Transcript_5288:150-1916(-)|eukprot:jgi/Bigna1/89975/estExt_fgenesh1_pg.C_590062